jgi:hypothetical protein
MNRGNPVCGKEEELNVLCLCGVNNVTYDPETDLNATYNSTYAFAFVWFFSLESDLRPGKRLHQQSSLPQVSTDLNYCNCFIQLYSAYCGACDVPRTQGYIKSQLYLWVGNTRLFFLIASFLWTNSELTNLQKLSNAEFYVLRGPRAQDAGAPSLSSGFFF